MRLLPVFSVLCLCLPTLQAQAMEIDFAKCASGVDIETIRVLAQEVSGMEPYAVTPFGGETLPYANPIDATATLQDPNNKPQNGWLVGLMQIHSKTIENEGLKLEDALDPCTNVRITAKELKACMQTKRVARADNKLKPLLRCFFSTRMTKDDIPERIQSVVDRVKPTVPALSSLMKPATEEPLVFSVHKTERQLIF